MPCASDRDCSSKHFMCVCSACVYTWILIVLAIASTCLPYMLAHAVQQSGPLHLLAIFPPACHKESHHKGGVPFWVSFGSLAMASQQEDYKHLHSSDPLPRAPQIPRTADADAPLTKDADRPLDGIFLPFLVNNPASWPHDVDTRALYMSSSRTYISSGFSHV